MFARRTAMPQVNKSKWTSFAGFFRGYPALPDAERVRFYAHVFDEQVPAPYESVLRCDRHAAFALRLGEPWLDVAVDADGVRVATPAGEHRFDAVILGTGFDVNLIDRPELGPLAAQVLAWGDCVPSDGSPARDEIARFPYLGEGFQLLARPGADARTPHQSVVTALDALGQLGFRRISIATAPETRAEAKAATPAGTRAPSARCPASTCSRGAAR